MAYTQVDLSRLVPPDVIEPLDFEAILADMKDTVARVYPQMAPVLALESEPAVKVLEVCATFILMMRARVNDAARAVMLAYATGADLDHIGAMFGVERKIYLPATETSPALVETDEDLRYRVQLSLEGLSTAGPRAAYEFHALSASSTIKDVFVAGPDTPGIVVPPGTVRVFVLTRSGSGVAPAEVISAVVAALNAEKVRPLCDTVEVASAAIRPFDVTATLIVGEGADAAVETEARDALADYLAATHRIGATVARSGILAALHRDGVVRVILSSPAADILPAANEAPFATGISLTVE